MKAPIQFSPCWTPHNPKAAIMDGHGNVVAFATASTTEEAEQNASYITAALNEYIASDTSQISRRPLAATWVPRWLP